MFSKHLFLGDGEDAVEAPEDGEGQYDFSVFVPFVWASEQVAYAPNEIRHLAVGLFCHYLLVLFSP